jgi:hypothetical protein
MSTIFTEAELAAYMGLTLKETAGGQVTAAVNGWIENHTGRVWGQVATVVERYDYKPKGFFLRQMDITGITQIKLGWPNQPADPTVINPSSYYWNEFGRVTMLSPFANTVNSTTRFFNDLVEVTYTHGVIPVPDDLKLAALGIAAVMYRFAINGQQNIVATSVGSYRVETIGAVRGTGSAGPNPAMNTAEANYMIVDSYVKPRF